MLTYFLHALLSNIFVHFFSRFWGIYWDRRNYAPSCGKDITCWDVYSHMLERHYKTKKKLFRVIQKLSAHILYKLKVQKCPEIAAKNNLIVCLLNIVKNSKTIKQHFQFLGWKLISRRFCIEREKLDYTLQIACIILHGLTYLRIICYSKYLNILCLQVKLDSLYKFLYIWIFYSSIELSCMVLLLLSY